MSYDYSTPSCTIARTHANAVAVDVMDHAGYKAQIMAAAKLPDTGRKHKLPPGNVIPVIPIYCLPGCPEGWVREAGTFVVPVKPNIGLWFNWKMNKHYTTAVVPSVKGMNPITGRKIEGGQMEQYRDCCPKCEEPFAHGTFCPKCGFSHPPQNYVAHPDTLWWDGFYDPAKGEVHQFFYTEEMARDIASLAIGKENTVPAFGFMFYRFKHEPPEPQIRSRGLSFGSQTLDASVYSYGGGMMKGGGGFKGADFEKGTKGGSWNSTLGAPVAMSMTGDAPGGTAASVECSAKGVTASMGNKRSLISSPYPPAGDADAAYAEDTDGLEIEEAPRGIERSAPVKEVSIGGGAVIDQKLTLDKRPLDDYHAEPQATMRIYFCFEPQLMQIIQDGGIRPIEEKPDNWMSGMPLGD